MVLYLKNYPNIFSFYCNLGIPNKNSKNNKNLCLFCVCVVGLIN